MFATLDLGGNMSVLDMDVLPTKSFINNTTENFPFFQNAADKENERLGINSRSRNGCKECKRRKKRCDEIKPSCGRCTKAGVDCIWSNLNSKVSKLKQQKSIVEKDNIPNIVTTTKKLNEDHDKKLELIQPKTDKQNISLLTQANHDNLLNSLMSQFLNNELINFNDFRSNDNNNNKITEESIEKFGDNLNVDFNNINFTDIHNHFDDSIQIINDKNGHDFAFEFGNKNEESDKDSEIASYSVDFPEGTFLLESLKRKVGSNNYSLSFFELNLTNYPSQKILNGLGQEEIVYLDYYRTCVSQTVSILPNESNFFLTLYLPLAENNKSILYALIGWGGIFLNDSKDQELSLKYLNMSLELSKQELKNKKPINIDRLAFTSLYTILCAALICAGDVKEWYKHFKTLHKFLLEESNGDLKEIKKCLGDYKESKWLISNFLYHDVLASISHAEGTCFRMDEYCKILDLTVTSQNKVPKNSKDSHLKNILSNKEDAIKQFDNKLQLEVIDNDLVCDPLQGCVRPLYVLIGEISNTYVDLKNMESELELYEKTYDYNDYIELRNKIYIDFQEKYLNLETQLKNTKPHTRSLCYLKSDKDLELHLTLFEAYRLSSSIYLKTLAKKIPPASPEIQLLLVELIQCINIIFGSIVQASSCFPLLMAGMSCVLESDKLWIEEKVSEMSRSFPVKNFKRILVIIKENWKINNKGLECIHWFDISHKLGWELCLA